jgi:endonuclease/exonuclease/phosphatase family metal-dependent hydrolase
MRLLQLNAWSLRLGSQVAEMIKKESPDVALLQEILQSDKGLGFFPTLNEFQSIVRFHHHYYSPVYGFKWMEHEAEFGNAIISNLEFHDTQTVFTHAEYTHNFSYETSDYNARNFQHVVVADENDRKFHLINHHGYHIPAHKKGNDFTLKACEQIVDYAATLDGPVIITGDFNLEPHSESIDFINIQFLNLSIVFVFNTTRNHFTPKVEVCDYIFVNDQVNVKDFYVSKVIASDHQGLILDFEL